MRSSLSHGCASSLLEPWLPSSVPRSLRALPSLWQSKTHDFARAGAKDKEAANQDVLTTARARVLGATVGPDVGSRLLRAASTFPVRSRRRAPTLMCRDEPDTMILTRKMDLCLVVGLVWLGSTAEGTGGGELVTPPCQVCVVVVCFDTLAEEAPQTFDSRKRACA